MCLYVHSHALAFAFQARPSGQRLRFGTAFVTGFAGTVADGSEATGM